MKFELNNNLIYTDLACERRRADLSVKGVTYTETESDGITISTLLINSKEGAKSIGRDEGTYITVSFNDIWMITVKEREKISGIISQKIADISEKNAKIKIKTRESASEIKLPYKMLSQSFGLSDFSATTSLFFLNLIFLNFINPPLFRGIYIKKTA